MLFQGREFDPPGILHENIRRNRYPEIDKVKHENIRRNRYPKLIKSKYPSGRSGELDRQ